MSIKRVELAESLQARVPFDVSKAMFELYGIARGRGWIGTVEKLTDTQSLPDREVAPLLEALEDHGLAGEKLCRFYRTDALVRDALISKLKAAKPAKGAMQDAYPLLLGDEELRKLQLGQPTLLNVVDCGDGIAAVFGSVRALRVRETVDPNSLPVGAAQVLSNYDEVIGLKLIRHQALDVVWIPRLSDVIELRIDYPSGTHADIARASQNSTMAAFSNLLNVSPFNSPINLFPAIRNIYNAAGEGRVVELAFGTTTRSIKHERMRVSADCLRTELYHVGGIRGLSTPVRPYRLSVAYTVDIGSGVLSNPELNLHTTSYVAENPNPQLYDASIRKTVGIIDYEFLRSRVLHFA